MSAVPCFTRLRDAALSAHREGSRRGGLAAPQAMATFEAAVKLTQLLLAGQPVTAALIVERFEVSTPTAHRWMAELEDLLPVRRVAAPRAHARGAAPTMLVHADAADAADPAPKTPAGRGNRP